MGSEDIHTSHMDHSYAKHMDNKIENGNTLKSFPGDVSNIAINTEENIATCQGDDNLAFIMEPEESNHDTGTCSSSLPVEEIYSSFPLSGRRVVDIQYFMDQIIKSGNHAPFNCSFLHMELMKQERRGLASTYIFRCRLCNIIQKVHTDNADCSDVDVNTGIVFGATSIGIGYSQCNELLTTINVPFMAANTFASKERNLATVIHKTTIEVMEEAGVEEAQLAREAGDIDSEGIPCITVVADGAWSKRSYNVNYNAASGVACIIGKEQEKTTIPWCQKQILLHMCESRKQRRQRPAAYVLQKLDFLIHRNAERYYCRRF
ncbi:hypothetical protein QE152_g18110 [Popillia japonica]|uniref:Mutator-like transposase domain-containing protein n=1 Tax=Popillia japonica TaxID=7064 RepID=A0AAW1L4D8_POPJA